jgi:hypothetical protein
VLLGTLTFLGLICSDHGGTSLSEKRGKNAGAACGAHIIIIIAQYPIVQNAPASQMLDAEINYI